MLTFLPHKRSISTKGHQLYLHELSWRQHKQGTDKTKFVFHLVYIINVTFWVSPHPPPAILFVNIYVNTNLPCLRDWRFMCCISVVILFGKVCNWFEFHTWLPTLKENVIDQGVRFWISIFDIMFDYIWYSIFLKKKKFHFFTVTIKFVL